ncbi:MAG: DMT family transporter [Armatimonadota bacterium]
MHYPRFKLSPKENSHLIGIGLVLAAMVLWSTVAVGTKLLVDHGGGTFSVAFLSAARLWMAAVVFIIIRVIHARKAGEAFRVHVKARGWLLIAALALCANYLLYGISLQFTTAAAASVVSQFHAVVTVLLAAYLLGERLTGQKIAGVVVAMAGVMLVVFRGSSLHDMLGSQHFLGNLLQIGAALAWPFYAIGQTKLLEESGNREALMPIFVIAALITSLTLPFTGPLILQTPSAQDWFLLIFLGIGSTAAAYWLFAAGLQRIETSEGTMFCVLSPPLAILMAHWLLGESMPPSLITGLTMVVIGLILIAWQRQHVPARKRRRLPLPQEQKSPVPHEQRTAA